MKNLLQNKELLNWGIFALVTIVIFYYFGSRTGKNAGKDYTDEITAGGLTYDPSRYGSLADRLETAMEGFADDEEAVYSVMKELRTKSDVLQLKTAFGRRRMPFTIGNSNLNTWLNYRLTKKEVSHVNEILQRNNIEYQF